MKRFWVWLDGHTRQSPVKLKKKTPSVHSLLRRFSSPGMCKHFNIDVGPQALQCSPRLYICHHQHPSKCTRQRKLSAILARVVSNGHEYFISDVHVSSPWREDYFYLPPPKWNRAQLSMFFCVFFGETTGSYLHREQRKDANM